MRDRRKSKSTPQTLRSKLTSLVSMKMRGAITRAVRACILTTAVMVGDATSLKHEPTLAPTSDAACASEPLPPNDPRASTAVLDLTHLHVTVARRTQVGFQRMN